VTPAPRCSAPGLDRHRLDGAQPVVVGLLEHLPGDVPFSTHLELENARARLVERALGEALERLAPETRPPASMPGEEGRPDRAATTPREPPMPIRRPRLEVRTVTLYVQRRQRWPLGGLIDLVV